ncbi:MAG TPA: adenylosuccinate lyase [Actinomycetota bacterium]|nr:adenylosuccinate lyase [Actinomycetota bacterium]
MIPRYSRDEMSAIFSDRAKFSRWLEIEILAVEARVRLGEVSVEELSEIKERAAFDPARIAEIEEVRHHDVVAFVENVRENVGDAGRHIHFGLTSSDVVDTATAAALRDAGDLLVEEIGRLLQMVRRRALEHRDTVMAGRTHGVHAEPTTFGHKLAGWAFELGRDRERLRIARDQVAVGKLSGAVGTYSQLSPEVETYVCDRLGLRVEDAATQVVARDRHAEFLAVIATTGASLERFAQEIRHLQRTEVREVSEPFGAGQKGSSAMPHKRNPVVCERICGLARLLRAFAQTGFENVALWHERDISHSSVERVTLGDACTLLDYMLDKMRWVVDGMEVDAERMSSNLDASYGLVHSQSVLSALLSKAAIQREEAYSLVQRNAMLAWEKGRPLIELLKSDPDVTEHLDPDEIDKCFDLSRYLARTDTVFDRLEEL